MNQGHQEDARWVLAAGGGGAVRLTVQNTRIVTTAAKDNPSSFKGGTATSTDAFPHSGLAAHRLCPALGCEQWVVVHRKCCGQKHVACT